MSEIDKLISELNADSDITVSMNRIIKGKDLENDIPVKVLRALELKAADKDEYGAAAYFRDLLKKRKSA